MVGVIVRREKKRAYFGERTFALVRGKSLGSVFEAVNVS